MATSTLACLSELRNDDQFNVFWDKVKEKQCTLDLPEPRLGCHRKAPSRFEVGTGKSQPSALTPKDHYRHIYFDTLDMISVSTEFMQIWKQFY